MPESKDEEKEAEFQIPECYKKGFKFVQPTKQIILPVDLEAFKNGKTYSEYMEFLADLQQSVKSKPISATPKSKKFHKVINYLTKLSDLVDQVPPI